MNRLPTQPDQTPIPLYNPSLNEFSYTHDGVTYLLAGLAVETFPKYLAMRMANRLADTILSQQGVRTNHEQDKEALLSEILINYES